MQEIRKLADKIACEFIMYPISDRPEIHRRAYT